MSEAATAPADTATPEPSPILPMSRRFRGFLPVVVDVETGGFESRKHALLEIAAIPLDLEIGSVITAALCDSP